MSNDFRFVEKLANAPWLCEPEHVEFLHTIFVRYLERAAAGERFDPRAVEQAVGRPLDNTREVTVRGGVARIPVEGTIVRRASLFTEISGGVSTEAIAKDFITAYNDATVHSILFVFDSPGGEAHGVNELSQMIREKRDLGEKRIEAYCDGMCASAAYWLASATSKLTTDAFATVGSIGVVTRVRNPDAVKTKADLEFVSARSPKKRLDPNTETGKEALQGFVDDLGDEFIQTVADNRGVSFEKVVQDFGQGFVMTGRRAVAAGMADELGSEEGVIASLMERERRPVGIAAVARVPSSNHSGTKEEELTEQATEQRPEETTASEEDARGIVATIRRLVSGPNAAANHQGVDLSVPAAAAEPDETDEATDDEVARASEPGEETNDGMSEETATATEATEATTEEGREDALSAEEREELLRLRAEREADRAEKAQLAATVRARGIDRMLDVRGTFDLGEGKRGAMPKAQRDAAETLIATLAASGADPIELSASGEATLKDSPAGKAVANLLTNWKPVELGERGTIEGEARSEGAQGDDERVRAELSERNLGPEHYEAVAAELAAKGEIRRED